MPDKKDVNTRKREVGGDFKTLTSLLLSFSCKAEGALYDDGKTITGGFPNSASPHGSLPSISVLQAASNKAPPKPTKTRPAISHDFSMIVVV